MDSRVRVEAEALLRGSGLTGVTGMEMGLGSGNTEVAQVPGLNFTGVGERRVDWSGAQQTGGTLDSISVC